MIKPEINTDGSVANFLPAFDLDIMQETNLVTLSQPIRPRDPDAWIHLDGDPFEEPVGAVYKLLSGRVAFLPFEGRGDIQFSEAFYLNKPQPDLFTNVPGNSQPISKLTTDKELIDVDNDPVRDETDLAELRMLPGVEKHSPDCLPKAIIG